MKILTQDLELNMRDGVINIKNNKTLKFIFEQLQVLEYLENNHDKHGLTLKEFNGLRDKYFKEILSEIGEHNLLYRFAKGLIETGEMPDVEFVPSGHKNREIN